MPSAFSKFSITWGRKPEDTTRRILSQSHKSKFHRVIWLVDLSRADARFTSLSHSTLVLKSVHLPYSFDLFQDLSHAIIDRNRFPITS